MVPLRIVTTDELRPLVTLLRDIPKPIPFTEFPALFERLTWVRDRPRGGRSNFDLNLPLASGNELRGELSRLDVRVSDTIKERGPAAREAVRAALPELTARITECIGFPPTGSPLHHEGVDWDLEDGSVIRLFPGQNVLELMFMSKVIADNELRTLSRGEPRSTCRRPRTLKRVRKK